MYVIQAHLIVHVQLSMPVVSCGSHIHHFHIDHNAPSLRPTILHISLGMTVIPRRNWKLKGYAKFWGVNKVYYGLCESSEKVDTTHTGGKEDKILALPYRYLYSLTIATSPLPTLSDTH